MRLSTPRMGDMTYAVGWKCVYNNFLYYICYNISTIFLSLISPCQIIGSIIFFYSSIQNMYEYPARFMHLWKYSTAEKGF